MKKLLKNDLLENKPFCILIIFYFTISLALNFKTIYAVSFVSRRFQS